MVKINPEKHEKVVIFMNFPCFINTVSEVIPGGVFNKTRIYGKLVENTDFHEIQEKVVKFIDFHEFQ